MIIGFVGLGLMGRPMAGHLLKAATSFSPTTCS
jgi:3-hydroxyisobutyrate dehydrogenase-like beta-hydroxyacid dehydrogenase